MLTARSAAACVLFAYNTVAAQPLDWTTSLAAKTVSKFLSSNNSEVPTTCVTNNGVDPASFDPPLYSESVRPQIHYSPTSGFMNDPNGLVRIGDTWHLYFQYNPNDTVAGFQHWGHATSKDLYTWQNYPPAIAPESDDEGIFTGSSVLDVNNTSGFFDEITPAENRIVAIYTLNTPTDQNQNVAYSTDGQNFVKYSGNPVISRNTTQFRDPQVMWDANTSKWVMTVVFSQDYSVAFFTSYNLKEWTEVSRFHLYGILGYQYECPNLVKIKRQGGPKDGEDAYILIIAINPGAPLGGSVTQYFVGEFDGTHFIPDDPAPQLASFGKEFYAPQVFYNTPADEPPVYIGWASNWQYTNSVPTSPYRGIFTVAREMHLVYHEYNPMFSGYSLAQTPYPYDKSVAVSTQVLVDQTGLRENQTQALNGDGAFDIQVQFSIPFNEFAPVRGELRIEDEANTGHLLVGFELADPVNIYVDRRFAGQEWADTNVYFTDRFSAGVQPLVQDGGEGLSYNRTSLSETAREVVNLRLIVDRTVTEVFAQNGLATAVASTFWDNDSRPANLKVGWYNPAADDGSSAIRLDSFKVTAIGSTWPSCP